MRKGREHPMFFTAPYSFRAKFKKIPLISAWFDGVWRNFFFLLSAGWYLFLFRSEERITPYLVIN
jgi:hypothetical protein